MDKQLISSIQKYNKLTKNSSVHIIRNPVVSGNMMYMSDVDSFVEIDLDKSYENKTIDIKILKTSNDIEVARKDDFNIDDFPFLGLNRNIEEFSHLPFNTNLAQFKKYCGNGITATKKILQCVYFSSDNNDIVATDGHRVLKINNRVEKDCFIHWQYIDTIESLKNYSPVNNSCFVIFYDNVKFLCISGNGWRIYLKQSDEHYPNYTKIFPDYKNVKRINNENKLELRNACKQLLGYVNTKTYLSIFQENKIWVRQEDVKYVFKLSFDFISANGEPVGVNTKYLDEILKDLDSAEIIEVGTNTAISVITFVQGDKTILLMPLRLRDEIDYDDLKTINVDIQKPTVKKTSKTKSKFTVDEVMVAISKAGINLDVKQQMKLTKILKGCK